MPTPPKVPRAWVLQGCVLTCHAAPGLGHLYAPLVTLARSPRKALAASGSAAPRTGLLVASPRVKREEPALGAGGGVIQTPRGALRGHLRCGGGGGPVGGRLAGDRWCGGVAVPECGLGRRPLGIAGGPPAQAGAGVLTVVETRILVSAHTLRHPRALISVPWCFTLGCLTSVAGLCNAHPPSILRLIRFACRRRRAAGGRRQCAPTAAACCAACARSHCCAARSSGSRSIPRHRACRTSALILARRCPWRSRLRRAGRRKQRVKRENSARPQTAVAAIVRAATLVAAAAALRAGPGHFRGLTRGLAGPAAAVTRAARSLGRRMATRRSGAPRHGMRRTTVQERHLLWPGFLLRRPRPSASGRASGSAVLASELWFAATVSCWVAWWFGMWRQRCSRPMPTACSKSAAR